MHINGAICQISPLAGAFSRRCIPRADTISRLRLDSMSAGTCQHRAGRCIGLPATD